MSGAEKSNVGRTGISNDMETMRGATCPHLPLRQRVTGQLTSTRGRALT